MSTDPLSVSFQTGLKLGQSEPVQQASKVPLTSQVAATTSTSTSTSASAEILHDFVIGRSTLSKPLVTIAAVKSHLQVLRLFSELEAEVIELPFLCDFRGWRAEVRWRYFVGVAVERFDVWCGKLNESDLNIAWDVFLPPIDVLMVWHSYLLNPLWYAEDAERIPRCRILSRLGCHLTAALESDRLASVLKDPVEERKSFWAGRTSLDFDYKACLKTYRKKPVRNICCSHVDEIDFCNKPGTGYLQKDYLHICSNKSAHSSTVSSTGTRSEAIITRRTHAVHKLAIDLAKSVSTAGGYLAGAYLAASERDRIREEALNIKSTLISHIESDTRIGKIDGSDRFLWEMSRNYTMADIKGVIGGSALAQRILSAYADDKVYSIELVNAVIRQGKFVEKIKELNWTAPSFPDKSDMRILPHAVARYHAFLDLMATHPGTMLVPTLDIDLVWHTHQLMSSNYVDDCTKYVGRFVDHDDKVEGIRLSTSFDQTGFLWRNRFKVPYTFCGCPTPSPKIKQRISTILNRTNSRRSYGSSITPPVNQAEATLATHPSDHNAVKRLGIQEYIDMRVAKAKEIRKNRSKLYKSTAYHPRGPYADNHPYQTTFLYPVPLVVDSSGLAGSQCAEGYYDPYVPPPPKPYSGGSSGGGGAAETSGDLRPMVTNTGYLQQSYGHNCSKRSARTLYLSTGSRFDVSMKGHLYAVQKSARDLAKSMETADEYLAFVPPNYNSAFFNCCMASFLESILCCCGVRKQRHDRYDETSHLIPHDQEPETTGEVYVDHQKLQERFGHIVRAKEGKMVNVASHIPFNLHNQVIPAESSRNSGSRSTSASHDPDSYHPHHRPHTNQRNYNSFNYAPDSPYSADGSSSHQQLLDPDRADMYHQGKRRSPSPSTTTTEQPRPTPILNIRLVGYQGKKTRGRARERGTAPSTLSGSVLTPTETQNQPAQSLEDDAADLQTPTNQTYASGLVGDPKSNSVNETLERLKNAGPIVMSWGD
ncbi:hypothetical protein BJ165DRAFT_1534302 [Panaeolus papilionaceus]|nr:hypothetical protein BJ165DRAFT_1534302 [Panaeolus papilionaceus]